MTKYILHTHHLIRRDGILFVSCDFEFRRDRLEREANIFMQEREINLQPNFARLIHPVPDSHRTKIFSFSCCCWKCSIVRMLYHLMHANSSVADFPFLSTIRSCSKHLNADGERNQFSSSMIIHLYFLCFAFNPISTRKRMERASNFDNIYFHGFAKHRKPNTKHARMYI